jgi:hypothetical protein
MTHSKIQPACPLCTAELTADGICLSCDPVHTFILIDDEIILIDDAGERADARELMLDSGVTRTPILRGRAGQPGEATGEQFTAEDPAALSESDFADLIARCLNPETSEAAHQDIEEQLTARVLTGNAGLVIRIGDAEFQVSVVRAR